MRKGVWWGALGLGLLIGCSPTPAPPTQPAPVTIAALRPTLTPTVLPTLTSTPSPTPLPTVALTPSAACGQRLPVQLPSAEGTPTPPIQLTVLDNIMPVAALPAVQRLFDAPDSVAVAAYTVGREAEGVYWRADEPMPLASVVKLVHLIAYAQAVDAGAVQAGQSVALDDLARFYLPGSDLNAHAQALAELAASQQLVDRALPLSAVVWMMVRYSDNAATDYLQTLLGQAVIEQTARDLGLEPHSAPCPFIGRFLLMSNHTRRTDDSSAVAALISDPARYALEVAHLTDLYSQDAAFRAAEQAYWGVRRRPSVAVQSQFTAALDTRSTARAYADLLARTVNGQVGTPRVNNLVRYYLEWPLQAFPTNRERYLSIGYKNGALPGVLTTVYYAWPRDSAEPLVVALFYRDLPLSTYQQWRRTLPDDALAHWLLSDPQAIPRLRQWLAPRP